MLLNARFTLASWLESKQLQTIQAITYLYKQTAELPAAGTIGVLATEEKEKLVAKILASSPPALAETNMKIPLIKSCVKAIVLQDIDSQCQKLCQKKENPSVLRMTKDSEKELNKFQWISILTEMKEKAPDVLDILSAVALPNVKTDGSQIPRICTAYALLMNTRYYKNAISTVFFSQANLNSMFVNLAVTNTNVSNIQSERKS